MASTFRKRRSKNSPFSFFINIISIWSTQRSSQKSFLWSLWLSKTKRRTFCRRRIKRWLSFCWQSWLNIWTIFSLKQFFGTICRFYNDLKRQLIRSCFWRSQLHFKNNNLRFSCWSTLQSSWTIYGSC